MPIPTLNELFTLLKTYDEAYYNRGERIVDDEAYDKVKTVLRERAKTAPENIDLQKYLFTVKDGVFPTLRSTGEVTHLTKMYSQANVYDYGEYEAWVESALWSTYKDSYNATLHASLKYDGLSSSIRYDRKTGDLVSIGLRGTGGAGGRDITNISSALEKYIPGKIDLSSLALPSDVEVRGEFYVEPSDYKKYLELYPGEKYATCLSMAVGLVQQFSNDPNYREFNPVTFRAYGSPILQDVLPLHSDVMETLFNWGFTLVDGFVTDLRMFDDVWIYYTKMIKAKADGIITADGLVIRTNDNQWARDLGYTTDVPKFSKALKFPKEIVTSTIKTFVHALGYMGRLTPVAYFDDVMLNGKKISHASVYNTQTITKKGYGIGAVVEVFLAGGVIPALGKTISPPTTKYEEPVVCPYCMEALHRAGENQFCKNPYCQGVMIEKILYGLSTACLGIKNITRDDTIELIETGCIDGIYDLLDMSRSNLADALGERGNFVYDKLHSVNPKKIPIEILIKALCIPNLSNANIKKLVNAPTFCLGDLIKFLNNAVALEAVGITSMTSRTISEYVLAREEYFTEQIEKMLAFVNM